MDKAKENKSKEGPSFVINALDILRVYQEVRDKALTEINFNARFPPVEKVVRNINPSIPSEQPMSFNDYRLLIEKEGTTKERQLCKYLVEYVHKKKLPSRKLEIEEDEGIMEAIEEIPTTNNVEIRSFDFGDALVFNKPEKILPCEEIDAFGLGDPTDEGDFFDGQKRITCSGCGRVFFAKHETPCPKCGEIYE